MFDTEFYFHRRVNKNRLIASDETTFINTSVESKDKSKFECD